MPGAEPVAAFLADKSALTRRDTRPEVREALEPLLLAGEVATCGIVELELLYSATSRATYRALSEALRGMPHVEVDEGCVRRALGRAGDELVLSSALGASGESPCSSEDSSIPSKSSRSIEVVIQSKVSAAVRARNPLSVAPPVATRRLWHETIPLTEPTGCRRGLRRYAGQSSTAESMQGLISHM